MRTKATTAKRLLLLAALLISLLVGGLAPAPADPGGSSPSSVTWG